MFGQFSSATTTKNAMICCEQQGTIRYHAKIRFHVFLVTIQQIRNGRESQKGLQLVGVSRKWHTIFLSGRSNSENEIYPSESLK